MTITPLGGLGEIGKNMTAVECQGRIVLVDVGVMFPTAEMLGIDLVLPDFTCLRDRAGDIDAIVLTHGHEDHVGALPYFLKEMGFSGGGPKIYGGLLTISMVRSKLDEHRLKNVEMEELRTGDTVKAGPFEIELVHMAHSIPDMRAVALKSELGTVLITGDYKFDQTPVDGIPADVSRLAELGREGILCLCGDSTNADRPGVAPSESSVGPALLETFSRAEGRIVVTCFASNIHRVQQVIDAAEELDRKVALVGRSMRKNFNIASNLEMAHVSDGLLVQPKEIEDFPDERMVVICTGSQGEPLSALRRMANNDHRDVELHSGDTVIFSATPIPGNERSVNETVDRIFQVGAKVVTAADAPIHASGHGWQEELKLMLNLTKPRYVLPFHGDHKRMRLHGQLAQAVGIEPERIYVGQNGLSLDITGKGASFGTDHRASMIFVDGVSVGEPDEFALRDRRKIADDGVVIVVATISAENGESVAPPEVILRGVPFAEDQDEDAAADEIAETAEKTLARLSKDGLVEINVVQEDLHDDIARAVNKSLRRRPLILPVVVEV